MINLFGAKVAITGASSMISRSIIPILKNRGAMVIPCYHSEFDLTDQIDAQNFFSKNKPDYCISLATNSGSAWWNTKYPADTFRKTSLININTLTCAKDYGVKKTVSVLSSCAIADLNDKELKESDLYNGKCNDSIASHGYAKRTLDCYSRFLRQQFNFNGVTCILQNCYGSYDRFDKYKAKVVGALIKKIYEAKINNTPFIQNFGDGSNLRELIYVEDAAEGIVQVLEKYEEVDPINITSDIEISIKDLTDLICELVGYTGKVQWEKGPSGQMRKKLNSDKMKQYLNFNITPIKTGLMETIQWYKENKDNLDEVIKW